MLYSYLNVYLKNKIQYLHYQNYTSKWIVIRF